MAKNEIPKISDFPFLGLCDGFAKVSNIAYMSEQIPPQVSHLMSAESPTRKGPSLSCTSCPRTSNIFGFSGGTGRGEECYCRAEAECEQ